MNTETSDANQLPHWTSLEVLFRTGAGMVDMDLRVADGDVCEGWWYIGITDRAAVWIVRRATSGVDVLDYIEDYGKPLSFYLGEIEKRGYHCNRHVAPPEYMRPHWSSAEIPSMFVSGSAASLDDGTRLVSETIRICRFSKAAHDGFCALRAHRVGVYDWTSVAEEAFRLGVTSMIAEKAAETMTATATTHQPIPVSGYTPQSQSNIDLANEGKALEERYLRWLDKLAAAQSYDPRCIAEARTCIQTGAMWAIRSIFQPKRISLPKDTP